MSTGIHYAIKRLNKQVQIDHHAELACITERDAMVRIRSPFTMPVVHSFQDSRYLYLVQPLMATGTCEAITNKLPKLAVA